MIDTAITDEAELKQKARALTGYDTTHLPDSDLDQLVDVSAMLIKIEANTDEWFDERELGAALLFTLCIKMKERVENYSVDGWEIGDESIEVSGASADESAQLSSWAQNVSTALENSQQTTSDYTFNNTASYIGG